MDKVRQWSVLTALGVIAVLALGWFMLVSPQRAKASDLRAKAVTQEQQNDTLRTQVAGLRAQQKNLPAQQAQLAQIAAKIPDNPALPPLVRALSDAAQGSGVDLASLSPALPTMVNAAAAQTQLSSSAQSGTGASTTPATSVPLAQIPVTIKVNGSYFNVEQFVSSLEGLKRALKVTGFAFDSTAPYFATISAVVYMTPPVAAATTTSLQPAAPAAPAKK